MIGLQILKIMMFSNLMNALFGTNSRPDIVNEAQEVAVPVVEKEISPSVPYLQLVNMMLMSKPCVISMATLQLDSASRKHCKTY